MTDYTALIDAETWAFIERTNAFYPPDATGLGIADQRAVYDRMCRAFHAGYPDGITAETSAIDLPDRSLPLRIYRGGGRQDAATVLYFHGGGFVVGGLESHDDVCAELAAGTGFEVVSVDYRLAPEHVHPAAFDDAMAAFAWAVDRTDRRVVLAGDSAGGNLAAAVSHHTRSARRPPAGQALIYPALGGDMGQGSYVVHAEAPMLGVADIRYYERMRAGAAGPQDASLSPLADTDFSGLPPTVVITAECDPLSSDGETYRDRIEAAGGLAWWHEEPGLVHGYLRARHMAGRARTSFARIVAAICALGEGRWPHGAPMEGASAQEG